jgi:hypothetical protein
MKRVVQFESKNAVAAVSYYDHNSAIAVSQRHSDLGVGQERDFFPDNRPAS